METLELKSIAESIHVSPVGPPATVAVHKECIKQTKDSGRGPLRFALLNRRPGMQLEWGETTISEYRWCCVANTLFCWRFHIEERVFGERDSIKIGVLDIVHRC
jgi:hypothetical protein